MTDTATKDFWIFEQNLVPTLLILSHLVGYDFDDDDFNAIEYGLTGTSNERDLLPSNVSHKVKVEHMY